MTYKKWRITGDPGPGYPPYTYTWSSRENPDESAAEHSARAFLARIQGLARSWERGQFLHCQTITESAWVDLTDDPGPRVGGGR
jgi:hypothetical protein